VALFAAVVVMAAAASSGAQAASGSPIAVEGGISESGYPLGGSGPTGITVRFIDQGSFWVAVLLQNRSSTKQTVTLLGARTVEPLGSLVQQTSATFTRYHPCTGSGDRICPYPTPNQPSTPGPLSLKPGQMAAVTLRYRLVSCATAQWSTTASARDLTISYQTSHSTTKTETVPLGSATLHLQKPAGIECLPRPESHIGLVGSFTTSPGHRPVPGSDGDTCTRTRGGGLSYKSRFFLDRTGTEFRISITLPHYHGPGNYQPRNRPGRTLGPNNVTASGGFGLHGWTIFHNTTSTVTVTTAHGATLGGHLDAVFSGHRRFFRAYGSWRCTLLH
jgi:hypothetical protein